MSTLTFSAPAWAKIQFLCHHHADTEVAFLLIPTAGNPLYIQDVYVPEQEVTAVTYELAPEALGDYALDIRARFPNGDVPVSGNLRGHTHPGNSPTPSTTDERDFDTSFGKGWGVMFILARGGKTYARLRTKEPVIVDLELEVAVDWAGWAAEPAAMDVAAWWKQFEGRVRPKRAAVVTTARPDPKNAGSVWFNGYQFSADEWETYMRQDSQDWVPPRDRGRKDKRSSRRLWTPGEEAWAEEEEEAPSAWHGVEVMYEVGRQHGVGRVIDVDEDTGWLTIRDITTGELVEAEEEDVTPTSEAALYGVPTEDDVLERLEARVDESSNDYP